MLFNVAVFNVTSCFMINRCITSLFWWPRFQTTQRYPRWLVLFADNCLFFNFLLIVVFIDQPHRELKLLCIWKGFLYGVAQGNARTHYHSFVLQYIIYSLSIVHIVVTWHYLLDRACCYGWTLLKSILDRCVIFFCSLPFFFSRSRLKFNLN